MDMAMISGNVNANGTVFQGSGFRVVREEKGVYSVLFDASFPGIPSVVLTQNYPGWSDFADDGGDTRDNAVLIAVGPDRFKYKTGDSTGKATDRNCAFIAVA
jgi:hypothetical protein